MGFDDLVDLAHEADGFVEGNDDAVVVADTLVGIVDDEQFASGLALSCRHLGSLDTEGQMTGILPALDSGNRVIGRGS